jgi:hypothetical protein
MRRILATLLAVSVIAATLPSAAFADDTSQPTSTSSAPSMVSQRAAPLDLRNVARGVLLEQLPREGNAGRGGFMKSPKSKAIVVAAIIAAALVVGYKASQGPDPTPATAR